uniref:Predicted protein n=1 Tax=Hordeum vulgare subsp. vulgare TaxID=112509 RepID=F2D7D6_HORVV|nr:predicted protein [Hordeum vulgare subsp. vulgare]
MTSSHYGFSGGVDLVAGGLLLMLATEMNILGDGGAACEILLPNKAVVASSTLCRWIPSSPTRPPSDPLLCDKATIGSPPLRDGHGEHPSGRVRLDISRLTLAESSRLDSTNYSNHLVDLDHHRVIPRVGLRVGGHFPAVCQPLSASVVAWESIVRSRMEAAVQSGMKASVPSRAEQPLSVGLCSRDGASPRRGVSPVMSAGRCAGHRRDCHRQHAFPHKRCGTDNGCTLVSL